MPNDQSFPGIQQIRDSPTATAVRFIWDKLQALADQIRGPRSGTLNPDRRPRLTTNDSGTKFFATDFNREFTWTGTAWVDSATAPTRGQTAYFDPTLGPSGAGWIPCDGRAVAASTSSGGTTYYTTPILPNSGTLIAYVRV